MSLQQFSPAARRVHRLHVRASAEDEARHAAVLLADALSTASLPDADRERLIVIRRLALGRIPGRVSPASLALHIERVTQDIMSQAVTYDVASAGAANAVAFPDRGEAIIALARLHATGASGDEWFWPAVVHGWHPGASRGDRWSRVLEAAHAVPEAAVVAAAVLDQAIRARAQDELLASIPSGRGVRWLRAAGWGSVSPLQVEASWRPLASVRSEIVQHWKQQWGPADDRLIWLATLLTVLEHRTCLGDPQLLAKIAFALEALDTSTPPRPVDRSPQAVGPAPPPAASTPPSIAPGPAGPVPSGARANIDRALPVWPPDVMPGAPIVDATFEHRAVASSPPGPLAIPQANHPAKHVDAERVYPEARTGFFTPFAGLLFVVPILERLEFATFLASQPALLDGAFPARLVRFIGRQAGIPLTDPLALAFDAEIGDDEDTSLVGSSDLPYQLPIRARDILAAPAPRLAINSVFTVWLTAVRRWCRRRARFGLTTLIRRPGRIQMTRTHLDVSFALSQLDVRVRRVALDVDPGWVPWMGRVVQFRYDAHDLG
jgi:hypothetical protein